MTEEAAARRRLVAVAGHAGDEATIRAHANDRDPRVRATALGALARCGRLDTAELRAATHDPHPSVRRRAAQLAARRPAVPLVPLLADPDPMVAEMAAWASGERDEPEPGAVAALVALATDAPEQLCREAAVAALGALGDPAGLDAILRACGDRPNVRRRAVLALAPFDGAEVRRALEHALRDRDRQVRQAAQDLLAIADGYEERPR